MEISRRVFKNTIFLYTAEIFNAVALFILTLVMARTLGSAEFGKYAFTTSLIAIFSVFAELGITAPRIPETPPVPGPFPA